ncbi:SLAM family member 9-like isoform X2 [Trichosurus vulpecula]|uniref:SLAM family member 9-like isoform X2 n=1 Tax=Trichosurus vulpecula TaxID=9337 RepID=UPI00186B5242|nr:SLAM family member 9-like isoform X2 [Trichosurus vulpecula]
MTHLLQWLIVIICLQIEEAASTDNKVPLLVIGTVGKSVILPSKIPPDKILTIAWLSRNSLATVDLNGQPPHITITDYNYHNRLKILNESNYSLQIKNLTTEDENCYKAQITIKSTGLPETLIQEYLLHIYEELSTPQVTANFTESENGTCNVILLCSMEKEGKNVTYNWISLEGREEVIAYEGPNLTVSWRPGESEPNYICRVTNPVSSQRSQPIPSAGLCTGASSRNYVKLIIGIVVAVVLCVAIVIGSVFWKKKRQGFIQCSPNHVQQQEATTDGTTVYAQVSHPYGKAATLPETSAYNKHT